MHKDIRSLYAWTYMPDFDCAENGWDFYDAVEEYKRMGVPSDEWCLSDCNQVWSGIVTWWVLPIHFMLC